MGDDNLEPPKDLSKEDIAKKSEWLKLKILETQARTQKAVLVWNRWKVVGLVGGSLSTGVKFLVKEAPLVANLWMPFLAVFGLGMALEFLKHKMDEV